MSRSRGLALVVVAIAAAALAAALALTGGGDEPSSQQATQASSGAQEGGEGGRKSDSAEGGEGSEAQGREGERRRAPPSVPPEQVERIDPPPPTEGDDDSIETFGEEASAAEADAVASVLAGFLRARVRGDWDGACALMASGFAEQLAELHGQAQEASEDAPAIDCPSYLAATAGAVPERNLRRLARVRLASVRVEDERAFAIYKSGYPHWVFMPMVREEAGWRVAALDSSALP